MPLAAPVTMTTLPLTDLSSFLIGFIRFSLFGAAHRDAIPP
jgi:hypothetical protein